MKGQMSRYLISFSFLVFSLHTPLAAFADVKSLPPSRACDVFSAIGLPTLGWTVYFDNASGCSSRPKFLGPRKTFRNFISYYVEGNGQTVKELRLIVTVLNSGKSEAAHTEFRKYAEFLIIKITSRPAPESVSRSIENGIDLAVKIDDFLIEVKRKEWVLKTDSGSLQCHEIKLIIR